MKKEINRAIATSIEQQAFVGGKSVENFESAMAAYCQAKYAVGLNSGTDALLLALWGLGIKEGDEVITSPFSFMATASAIALRGAKPVFVDIDERTFTLDPSLVERSITKKTRAIIPVHIFGQSCDMAAIRKIAKKYRLYVIEDACQAVGALYNSRKVGGLADVGCISFYPTKNLGAYGDAGMIITNNYSLTLRIRELRNHGGVRAYEHKLIGINSRLDAIQAHILAIKLQYLDTWNTKRRSIAAVYTSAFRDLPMLLLPDEKNGKHIYHHYTLRVLHNKRNALQAFLSHSGIATQIYYRKPLHLQSSMRYLGYEKGDFPVTESVCDQVLSIPVYPELTEREVAYIIARIRQFASK